MSHSKKCAVVIERLTELLDVWEVPVTAAMLSEADPTYSRYTCTGALKQMVSKNLLYVQTEAKDRCFYFPTSKRPVCAIQQIICKGFNNGRLD